MGRLLVNREFWFGVTAEDRMSLPSLRQLQYLVSLHEHQHFGRAASACNVTQSTLSVGIKELEATLQLRLVERTRRVVVFTPVGARVVRQARDLLLRAQECHC